MTDTNAADPRPLYEAVKAGMEMRAAQVAYFRCRPGTSDKAWALKQAKALESKFDTLAAHAMRTPEPESAQ